MAAATLKTEPVEMAGLMGQFQIGQAAPVATLAARPRAVEAAALPGTRSRALASSD